MRPKRGTLPPTNLALTQGLFPRVRGRVFSEICLQDRAYNAASEPEGSILNAATRDIHSYMLWCWIDIRDRECCTATVALDRIHARFLRGFAPAGKRRRYSKASSMPSAACLPMLGIQCEYLSRVIVMEACPRRCWTSFG